MVTCKFIGRLGNIMLEIYNVFLYAKQKNMSINSIVFDKQYIGSGINPNKYKKVSPFFRVENYIEFNKEILANVYSHFIDHSRYEALAKNCRSVKYFEALVDENCKDNVMLNVPSSIRTFDKELFKSLFYVKPLVQKCIAKKPDLPQRIAIHVRRTDYAQYQDGKYLLTEKQVNDVVQQFTEEGERKFSIFSDDIEWCKQSIKTNRLDVVFYQPNVKSYYDMVMMSLCKKIYRNGGHSTFSYVAELLSKCYE